MAGPEDQAGVEPGDEVVADNAQPSRQAFELSDRGRLEDVEHAKQQEPGDQRGGVEGHQAATKHQGHCHDFIQHHRPRVLFSEKLSGAITDRDGDQGGDERGEWSKDVRFRQGRDPGDPRQAQQAADGSRSDRRVAGSQAGRQQQDKSPAVVAVGFHRSSAQLFSPLDDEYTRVELPGSQARTLDPPREFPLMSDEVKLDKTEYVKQESRQLRGTIAEELADDQLDHFSGDNAGLLKHHGLYQQDNRDARKQKNRDGKAFMFMVRTRIPGGRVSAEALLTELDLCERFGNQTLRITSRQGLQLHGVIKDNLQETIREINTTQLTTFGACGDIERNVMCCPAPLRNNPVREEMQQLADAVAEELKPRTTAYHQIWLEDGEGNREDVTEFTPVEEPVYGAGYLPRKFKTGVALPEDNCVDILTYDLGLLGIVENDRITGYNVFVGGGQGVTPSAAKTYVAIAQKMAFVLPEDVVAMARAMVCVFRDHGNRGDRKTARLKYLLADWGIQRFKATVEEYLGRPLDEPHPAEVTDVEDHLGWNAQGDGRDFLGIHIENGRIQDSDTVRSKSALRRIVETYRTPTRMTAQQNILLCDIEPSRRAEIDAILSDHGLIAAEQLSTVRRHSMACPALPTCGLSITESERVMPQLIDQLEAELLKQGIPDERIAVRMTGCPNGCARPYSPDIGLVGKTVGKYTVFLGGNAQGTRLAFNFQDVVPLEEIVPRISPVLAFFCQDREDGESFGDFCARKGRDDLVARIDPDGAGA